MKRCIAFCLGLLFSSAVIFSASLRVGLLNGPTCIPAANLMESETSKDCTFEQFADPQALLPKMLKGEIDVGFLPLNVAAKVYNSGNKSIKCAAVTGQGNISIITKDKNLTRFSQLKGKTVYTAGQGATPEYMLRYLLVQNNLTASETSDDDVVLDFSIPTAQLAALLISDKIQYAVVPEPFATIAEMKSPDVVRALDFQKEFQEVTYSNTIYPLSVMVVSKKAAEKKSKEINAFLKKYEKAVFHTLDNPAETAALVEKYSLGLSADVVEKAIPVSNYNFIKASEAKKMIEDFLNIFISFEPSSVGGKLPDEGFYYDPKNQ